jgi:hypothetical protein
MGFRRIQRHRDFHIGSRLPRTGWPARHWSGRHSLWRTLPELVGGRLESRCSAPLSSLRRNRNPKQGPCTTFAAGPGLQSPPQSASLGKAPRGTARWHFAGEWTPPESRSGHFALVALCKNYNAGQKKRAARLVTLPHRALYPVSLPGRSDPCVSLRPPGQPPPSASLPGLAFPPSARFPPRFSLPRSVVRKLVSGSRVPPPPCGGHAPRRTLVGRTHPWSPPCVLC